MKRGAFFFGEGGIKLHVSNIIRIDVVLYELVVISKISICIIRAQAQTIVFEQVTGNDLNVIFC